MWNLLQSQQKVIPDLIEKLVERLTIMQRIESSQPIGRRTLATYLGKTERILRAEVDFLKEHGLIEIKPAGMFITETGSQVLLQLFPLLHQSRGFTEWEKALAEYLGLQEVYIVPGDSNVDETVKKEMGRVGAHYLKNMSKEIDQIAVTGGTSIAAMAEMMVTDRPYPQITFFPARGGLGEHVDIQANTIAANLAKKMGASYLLLHVPDDIREETYRSLIEEPYVRERVEQIRSVRMVFHGIGNALSMAKRRGASQETIDLLKTKRAISEAFGYYFDQDGKIVYKMPTMGLHIEDLIEKNCIAIAGGSDKGAAISSLAKTRIFNVLITDEAAAKEILTKVKD